MVKKTDKRGAEASIMTLVFTVLGIIILVILVLTVMGVIDPLGSWKANLIGDKVNIEAVVSGCDIACSGVNEYDYCVKKRAVVFDSTKDKNPDNRDWTCDELAKSRKAVGLDVCDKIMCSVSPKKCEELKNDLCAGRDKCIVEWVDKTTFEKYKAEQVGEGKPWVSVEEVNSGYILEEERKDPANAERVCMKGILS